MLDKYFQLITNQEEQNADVYIYGDITSWEWTQSDVSSYTLAKALMELDPEITHINVYINSYGGEVAEGLAIYNALKRHKAKVTTYCDGFAASIASVIFMAGDERIMSNASLLFIHNAWTYASGNANDLRKQADNLEQITQASVNAYMERVDMEEDELKELLDAETWMLADKCLELGFATSIIAEKTNKTSQSVKKQMIDKLVVQQSSKEDNSAVDGNALEGGAEPTATGEEPKENVVVKFLENIIK